MQKKLKGALNLNALASIALTFVIVTIVLAMGGRVLEGVQDENCPYSYGTFNSSSEAVNPLSSNYIGCCQTTNTSDPNMGMNCSVWYSGAAYNATYRGLQGIATFADWMPLLAIIIISVIVIAMLMGGFGKSLGGGRA